MLEYALNLADGQSWSILGTDATAGWLKKFASILSLKVKKNKKIPTQKIIFTSKKFTKEKSFYPVSIIREQFAKNFPGNGWIQHNMGALHIWEHPSLREVICEILLGSDAIKSLPIVRMFNTMDIIYKKIVENKGLPFHAGLIEKDGKAYLLAAPGGVGKSTCCTRIPSPWKAISDDEALIVYNKDKKKYFVHPMPTWSDYLHRKSNRTWVIEAAYPLAAIFFLERAKMDKVKRLETMQAAVLINESTNQILQRSLCSYTKTEKRAVREKIFNNSCRLEKNIPCYSLNVSLHGKFWEEINKIV